MRLQVLCTVVLYLASAPAVYAADEARPLLGCGHILSEMAADKVIQGKRISVTKKDGTMIVGRLRSLELDRRQLVISLASSAHDTSFLFV